MKIGVNARLFLKGKLEGIGWYSYQTIKRIVLAHPEHEFVFFFDRPYDDEFVFAKNVTPVVLKPQARHPLLYLTWFDVSIPIALKKHHCDIFLSTDGFCSLRTKVPTCLVIHDLAFEHYPEHLRRMDKWYYGKYFKRFARKAKRIVTVSEYTKTDVMQTYGIDGSKIDVAYNAPHDEYRPIPYSEQMAIKAQFTDNKDFFLFTGALHPRKNIVNLLKAFIVFKRQFKTNMKLVIVGRMAWNYTEIEEMRTDMPFKDDVVWLGYVDVDLLTKITASAYAMVYPSLFEGFGIPIVEALKCNVPVITSNVTSMPEVVGEAGLTCDPTSHRDIAFAMGEMFKNELLRKQLIKNAPEQLAKFNWDNSAAVLWKNIEACLQ